MEKYLELKMCKKTVFSLLLLLSQLDQTIQFTQTASQLEFSLTALKEHNKYRKLHGVPPLILNTDLSQLAQETAEKSSFQPSHKQYRGLELGESFLGSSTTNTGDAFTNEWYQEYKNFDFKNPKYDQLSAELTQLIWKNTKQVGFGIAKFQDGGYYMVAYYYPAGNINGQFSDNVFDVQQEVSTTPMQAHRGGANDMQMKVPMTSLTSPVQPKNDNSDLEALRETINLLLQKFEQKSKSENEWL